MPNFFIVGAARCGTTSLFEAIAQHPDIFCCPVKEPNYFAFDFVRRPEVLANARRQGCLIDKHFDFTLAPPRVAFTIDESAYHDLFRGWKGQSAIGEASTTYLPSRIAPREIAAFQPDARIIVLLRNPIARTLSDYRMHVQNGHDTGSFSQFIAEEQKRSTTRAAAAFWRPAFMLIKSGAISIIFRASRSFFCSSKTLSEHRRRAWRASFAMSVSIRKRASTSASDGKTKAARRVAAG